MIGRLRESEQANPWMHNFFLIDEVFEQGDGWEGVKIIAMLRLIVLPFGITNYVLGVTSARFWQFALGSLAYTVKLFFHCYVGA